MPAMHFAALLGVEVERRQMNPKCDALTWMKQDAGAKDYIPCSNEKEVRAVLLTGLFAVRVHLCEAHQKVFCESPYFDAEVLV